jgi:hypothetical protein
MTQLDEITRPPHKGPGISPYRDAAMTPLDRVGLSQCGAGRFLDTDERQIRRWVAGDSRIPESVAKLLRVMKKFEIKPEDI